MPAANMDSTASKKPLTLKLKAWNYANPTKQGQYNARFAQFISKKLARMQKQKGKGKVVKWKVEPDQTQLAVAYQKDANKSFMPLETTFTHVSSKSKKSDFDLFDELFVHISVILKDRNLKMVLDMEKASMICWSLYDRNNPGQPKFSRWVLPVPQKPIYFPAERIEHVLYNLVSINLRQVEPLHKPCAPASVLSCMEAQFYRQKEAFALFSEQLDDLELCHDDLSVRPLIENNIATMESVDTALSTLVSLLENNVGRRPTSRSRIALIRKLKAFIRGPMATIAIDDAGIEETKRKARTELQTFQRISPILAAHIRLRDPSRRDELQRVCKAAKSGPEKTEMRDKLALSSKSLRDPSIGAAQLKKVRKHYEDTHAKVVAEVEALDKLVGAEVAKKGNSVWNIRGRLGRFWRKKSVKPSKRCAVEEKEARCDEDSCESLYGEDEKLGW